MEFGEAISNGFRNYVTFEGRASRSEYWYWMLFVFLVNIVTGSFDYFVFPGSDVSPTNVLASLALLLPGISVAVRRLHDIDRTGWWLLLVITIIGAILLFVWACSKGTDGPNKYGPDPLARQTAFAGT